jgi:flagellar biosynthetic protein FliO
MMVWCTVAEAATNEVARSVVAGSAVTPLSPWRPIGALLIVLGVLWLAARFMKGRILPLSGAAKDRRLKLVEKLSLSPKQAILLVRVDDREILIGVSEGAMESLTELDSSPTTEFTVRDLKP